MGRLRPTSLKMSAFYAPSNKKENSNKTNATIHNK